MFRNSSPTLAIRPNRFHLIWRILLLIGTLGLIVYFTLYLGFFMPDLGFVFRWNPDNVLKIEAVLPDSPSALHLQPGDVVLAVDGKPARWTSSAPLFTPGQENYQMAILRAGSETAVTLPANSPGIELIRERVTTGVVSSFIWLVAALIILFATPQNREAWQLGMTTLGAAVVLAASEAALYNIPGAWLFSNPLIPIVGVAVARVAFLPRTTAPMHHENRLFRLLYAAALVLSLLALWELVYLAPKGSSFELLFGVSSYEVLLLCLAGGAFAHLGILTGRFLRMPPSYQRQQVLIILVFTALAVLPLASLTILPRVLWDVPLLSWHVSITFLALIPAGYGYVIYRRNYLGLDIFVTHALTWLTLSFLFVLSYALLYYALYQRAAWQELGPLPGSVFLFLFFALVPYTSRHTRSVTERILYGPDKASENSLLQLTSVLSVDPQIPTLKNAVREVADYLQVRQTVLMLSDHTGQLVMVDSRRVNGPLPAILYADAARYRTLQLRQQKDGDGPRRLFDQHPWLECIVPLAMDGTVVGLLLLGRPVPDGYYNARQVAYLRQVAGVVTVATEAIRLFEASRAMSRTLIQVRDTERMQLASQIHDEPLQSISVVAGELGKLAARERAFGDGVTRALHNCSTQLQATGKRLRDICAGLHPPVLQQGAQLAVKDAVYAFRRKSDLNVVLDMAVPDALLISHDLTIAIYYILTEALNNVHKHARATTAWIRFAYTGEALTLMITDDGLNNGVAASSLSALMRARHFGIVGMYEWANLVHGELSIRARTGGGTVVSLTIPFANRSVTT